MRVPIPTSGTSPGSGFRHPAFHQVKMRHYRLFSIMQMFDHRGLLRNKGLPIGLYITRRLPALRSGWDG